MPVIIVGADTPVGRGIVETLTAGSGEVRVFVTDPQRAEEFRRAGCKVAMGDVSDSSHVALAAFECFTAVLIADAAIDDRERAFAQTPRSVLEGWQEAIGEAGVQRQIWIEPTDRDGLPIIPSGKELAVLSAAEDELAQQVATINELESIPDQLKGTS